VSSWRTSRVLPEVRIDGDSMPVSEGRINKASKKKKKKKNTYIERNTSKKTNSPTIVTGEEKT
jgi:hypothetical protein